jgi:hypothetical protein
MKLPFRVRASREDRPIAGSQVSVSVIRIEATLALAGLACGLAFATPIAVNDISGGETRSRPVWDYAIAARLVTLIGLLALAAGSIQRSKLGQSKRQGGKRL